jgi:hypothetical protein
MMPKIFKYLFISLAVYKSYKYLEGKLLRDERYLLQLHASRSSRDTDELVVTTIEEAKRLAKNGNIGLSVDYYLYAYKVLNCEWEWIISNIENKEVLNVITARRNQEWI